jgi:4-amino-4-deoxy-L-arabinose transferase-like glycosyltransferase
MTPEPGTRSDLAKQARLWLLSLICASVGAFVVWRTDALLPGVGAFLITLAVLGPALWAYERRRR